MQFPTGWADRSALRGLLKIALRGFGLRCVKINLQRR
jgi:hypothetical protein